jgi:hypothetical protein
VPGVKRRAARWLAIAFQDGPCRDPCIGPAKRPVTPHKVFIDGAYAQAFCDVIARESVVPRLRGRLASSSGPLPSDQRA